MNWLSMTTISILATLLALVGLTLSSLFRSAAHRHQVLVAAMLCILASPLCYGAAAWSGLSLGLPFLTAAPPEVVKKPRSSERVNFNEVREENRESPLPQQMDPPRKPSNNESRNMTQNSRQPVIGPAVASPQIALATDDRRAMTLDAAAASAAKNASPAEPRKSSAMWRAPSLVAALWLVGTMFCLLGVVRSFVNMRAILRLVQPLEVGGGSDLLADAARQLGVSTFPQIGTTGKITGPAVAGLIRPWVLIPSRYLETLSTDELRHVLLHEGAHALRLDPLIVLLQRCAASFFWWHPLVHLVNRRLSQAREDVCDNFVLRHVEPADYGATLLRLATLSPAMVVSAGAVGMLDGRTKLEDRIRELLDGSRNVTTHVRFATAATLFGVFALITAVVSAGGVERRRPVAQVPEQPQSALPVADVAKSPASPAVKIADAKRPLPTPSRQFNEIGDDVPIDADEVRRKIADLAKPDETLPLEEQAETWLGLRRKRIVPQLIEGLNAEPQVAANCLNLLHDVDPRPELTDALIKLASQPTNPLQVKALRRLEKSAADPRVVKLFDDNSTRLTKVDDPVQRARWAKLAGHSDRAIEFLKPLFLKPNHHEDRTLQAMDLLGEIGGPKSIALLKPIAAGDSWTLAVGAYIALGAADPAKFALTWDQLTLLSDWRTDSGEIIDHKTTLVILVNSTLNGEVSTIQLGPGGIVLKGSNATALEKLDSGLKDALGTKGTPYDRIVLKVVPRLNHSVVLNVMKVCQLQKQVDGKPLTKIALVQMSSGHFKQSSEDFRRHTAEFARLDRKEIRRFVMQMLRDNGYRAPQAGLFILTSWKDKDALPQIRELIISRRSNARTQATSAYLEIDDREEAQRDLLSVLTLMDRTESGPSEGMSDSVESILHGIVLAEIPAKRKLAILRTARTTLKSPAFVYHTVSFLQRYGREFSELLVPMMTEETDLQALSIYCGVAAADKKLRFANQVRRALQLLAADSAMLAIDDTENHENDGPVNAAVTILNAAATYDLKDGAADVQKMLNSKNSKIRSAAQGAGAKLQVPGATQQLYAQLGSDKPETREQAAKSLMDLKPIDEAERAARETTILSHIGKPSEDYALRALANCGGQRTATALEPLLNDPDARRGVYAGWVLAQLPVKAAAEKGLRRVAIFGMFHHQSYQQGSGIDFEIAPHLAFHQHTSSFNHPRGAVLPGGSVRIPNALQKPFPLDADEQQFAVRSYQVTRRDGLDRMLQSDILGYPQPGPRRRDAFDATYLPLLREMSTTDTRIRRLLVQGEAVADFPHRRLAAQVQADITSKRATYAGLAGELIDSEAFPRPYPNQDQLLTRFFLDQLKQAQLLTQPNSDRDWRQIDPYRQMTSNFRENFGPQVLDLIRQEAAKENISLKNILPN